MAAALQAGALRWAHGVARKCLNNNCYGNQHVRFSFPGAAAPPGPPGIAGGVRGGNPAGKRKYRNDRRSLLRRGPIIIHYGSPGPVSLGPGIPQWIKTLGESPSFFVPLRCSRARATNTGRKLVSGGVWGPRLRNTNVNNVWGLRPHASFTLLSRNLGPQTPSRHKC